MGRLELDNVHVTYEGESGENRPALGGISLLIPEATLVLVVGPSGAGKSTLTSLLSGLVPHHLPARVSGRVMLDGHDLIAMRQAELSQRVGIIFQDPDAQICTLTVEDEVAFGCENLCIDPDEIRRRILRELAAWGLDGRERNSTDALSGGEKQRLMLASVLAMEPEVLILDEPSSNLDSVHYESLVARIVALQKLSGITVIVVDHKADGWLAHADRLVVLHEGRVFRDGPPWEVFVSEATALSQIGVSVPALVSCLKVLDNAGVLQLRRRDVADTVASVLQAGCSLGPAHERGDELVNENSPAIEFLNVHFKYPSGRQVLCGVELDVYPGRICAIVGNNGSGKTTLGKIAAGLFEPTSGTLLHDGSSVAIRRGTLAGLGVGYLFQRSECQLFADSVQEEVEVAVCDARSDWNATELLKMFDLSKLVNQHPWDLSLGQRRRLALCATFPFANHALVLDEPTMGLDRASLDALAEALRVYARRGIAVLLSSHELAFVLRTVDTVAVLAGGRITHVGPPTDARLVRAVLGDHTVQCQVQAIALGVMAQGGSYPLPVTPEELAERLAPPGDAAADRRPLRV